MVQAMTSQNAELTRAVAGVTGAASAAMSAAVSTTATGKKKDQ